MRRLALVVLLCAAGLSTATALTLVAVLGGSPGPPAGTVRAATAWDDAARRAFGPLVAVAPTLSAQTADWQAGRISDATYRSDLDTAGARVTDALHQVSALPPCPAGAVVGETATESVRLYGDVVAIDQATVATPAGPLRTQLELLSRRALELSDRVFDRGRAVLAADLPPKSPTPGLTEHLPTDVPDWEAEGEAAGPPLAATAPPAAPRFPPEREPPRPRQSDPAWRRAVAALGLPAQTSAEELVTDSARRPEALQAAAAALGRGADALDRVPDPATGGTERADRFRLGLLCDADGLYSALAAQLTTGTVSGALGQVATDEVGIGGQLRHGAA